MVHYFRHITVCSGVDEDYQHEWGCCRYGQFTFGGENCPCGHGKTVECGCVTKARAKEGLEKKKETLTLVGILLIPAAGLYVMFVFWCLRSQHSCAARCRADQARKERDCAKCMSPSTARACTAIGNWVTPVMMAGGGVVLIVMAGGVDVNTDYWSGCP